MLVALQESRTEGDQSSFVMSLQNRGVVLTRPEKKKVCCRTLSGNM